MNRIKCAVVSMTGAAPGTDGADYLRWHLLDHMPEQYQLPGMLLGTRWAADEACVAARLEAVGPFRDLRNVVQYLMGEPVQRTLDEFLELGQRLRDVGRFPMRRPSIQLTAHALLHASAAPSALISPEVVPFRPHRGVLVLVEQPTGERSIDEWLTWTQASHAHELLHVPGCAGACMYGTRTPWSTPARFDVGEQYLTVVYLDDDPITVIEALEPVVRSRWSSCAVTPLLAAPMRSMDRWDAWP